MMASSERERPAPPGFTLRHTLRGHKDVICAMAWSPDGNHLVTASRDGTARIWDASTGLERRSLWHNSSSTWIYGLAISPDGKTIVTGSMDEVLRKWDFDSGKLRSSIKVESSVTRVDFISNQLVIVSTGSYSGATSYQSPSVYSIEDDSFSLCFNCAVYKTIRIAESQSILAADNHGSLVVIDLDSGAIVRKLVGHEKRVTDFALSPDGRFAISGSIDATIRVWDVETGREQRSLEGHFAEIEAIALSWEHRLLASKCSGDDTVRLWDCDTWQSIAILPERGSCAFPSGLAFHPTLPILASLGDLDQSIRIWQLDLDCLSLNNRSLPKSVQYTNAKVVLVGDSGVGKSGLGLVLSAQPYSATESTHGRHVRLFDSTRIALGRGVEETRETILWDLAGQPGYRLVHQLHLKDVSVALVVFDARSETDMFSGVRHWDRALRQAIRLQGEAAPRMKKFLVVARCDRGGVGASSPRIARLVEEHEFDGYFETSAKEGWMIGELAEAIRNAIDWESLPRVNSNELFQRIKDFIAAEKAGGRLLSTEDDLYRSLLVEAKDLQDTHELRLQFETCIGRVEARDLIRRLKFGSLVLIQPEILDAYASAIVNAAKEEPDGLGCLAESKAQSCEFRMSSDERIANREQERLLLIATIEDLLRHEIALREQADHGPLLVFPSQFTRDWEEAPDPPGKTVIFSFEGPILNVYATLAVRLSHSGLFERDEMWRNAAAYKARAGGRCGIYLREFGEGRGELAVFFDDAASPQTRDYFEEFVQAHLQPRVLPATFQSRRTVMCPACREIVPDRTIQIRRERGFDWVICAACNDRISLAKVLDPSSPPALPSPTLIEMDRTANAGRDRAAAALVVEGKRATGDFDVFLCFNSKDRVAVKEVGERLKEKGILPWLDEWELRPGVIWQNELNKQIRKIKSVAVFFGQAGLGPWQELEQGGFLGQFVKRRCPLIPVILESCKRQPKVPTLLENLHWVDFRDKNRDPLDALIWGVTGDRPGSMK